MNDAELLQSYTREGSETAFRSLVERHLPLVFGTARRVTGNGALAEEIAQTVFLLLAKKAPGLRRETILTGWLYRTTRFVATRALTAETRRKRREEEAATMQFTNDADPQWTHITPLLDDALGRLSETDRQALLHRFFEQRSLREVGTVLGVGEEAAKKRVARALDRLRTLLRRRGKKITVGALVLGLEAEASAAVPVALSAQLSAAVVAASAAGAGAATASGLVADVLAAWRWAKIKTALVLGTGVVAVVLLLPVIHQPQSQSEPVVKAAPATVAPARTTSNGVAVTGVSSPLPGSIMMGGQKIPLRSLTITVLDDATGKPIRDAQLTHMFAEQAGDKPIPGSLLTGPQGIAVVHVPESVPDDARMAQFGIQVSAANYASREINWLSSTGHVMRIVTNDYTIHLEHGITLSATVVDDQGFPLQGYRVGGVGSNYRGYSSAHDEARVEDFSALYFSEEVSLANAITTDWDGRFKLAHYPSDLKKLVISLLGPEDVRWKVRTTHGRNLAPGSMPEVSFEELKSGAARIVVPKGVTYSGVVMDSDGNPVAGAEVLEGVQWGNLKVMSRNQTSRLGRFTLANRPAREMILAASAEGFANRSIIITVTAGMPDVRIQLVPEHPLSARIVDPAGQPVPGATISTLDYLNEGLGYVWNGKSDANGRFVWRGAPSTRLFFGIAGPEGTSRVVELQPGDEQTIVLKPTDPEGVQVKAKATDAATGKPVESFKVKICHEQFNGSPRPTKEALNATGGEWCGRVSTKDVWIGNYPQWALLIEADGYESMFTRMYDFYEGDQTIELKLNHGITLKGTVLTPDGRPASSAELAVALKTDGVLSMDPVTLSSHGDGYMTTSDASGSYSLVKPAKAHSLVVVHDAGWAILPLAGRGAAQDIRLKPWARIEGVALSGGQPVVGERVNLSDLVWDHARPLQVLYQAVTDETGHFVFPRVPAGEYMAALTRKRWNWLESEAKCLQTPVSAEVGAVMRIELGSTGSTVVMRLGAGNLIGSGLTNVMATLSRDVVLPSEPTRDNYVTMESMLAARQRYASNPAVLNTARQVRTFIGEVAEDGAVVFQDIPPGRYIFEARLFKPANRNTRPDSFNNPPIGRLRTIVEVPETTVGETNQAQSTAPIQLGNFTLEPQ